MKTLIYILKAFLINVSFINIVFATNPCASMPYQKDHYLATDQVEAIIGDALCSLIDWKKQNNNQFSSTLGLVNEKLLPFLDVEYSTELALGKHWKNLNSDEKIAFKRDLKKSLIDDYLNILTDFKNINDATFSVDKTTPQTPTKAEVIVHISAQKNQKETKVTLRMNRKDIWRIYDLVFQSISIIAIEGMNYDSKIKRYGIPKLIETF